MDTKRIRLVQYSTTQIVTIFRTAAIVNFEAFALVNQTRGGSCNDIKIRSPNFRCGDREAASFRLREGIVGVIDNDVHLVLGHLGVGRRSRRVKIDLFFQLFDTSQSSAHDIIKLLLDSLRSSRDRLQFGAHFADRQRILFGPDFSNSFCRVGVHRFLSRTRQAMVWCAVRPAIGRYGWHLLLMMILVKAGVVVNSPVIAGLATALVTVSLQAAYIRVI